MERAHFRTDRRDGAAGFSRRARAAREARGFTLIELLLVVTVLSIIVVMAIPGIVGARKHANETSAISSLRTLSSAQIQYRTRFGTFGGLPELSGQGFVDTSLGDGEKSGYRFTNVSAPGDVTWAMFAQPVTPGVSGDRWFFVDESGVIRYSQGGVPTTSDPAVD
jgi:type IV pilus assembly protein PilA